jgi:adhesin transport system membrane fusion protein
MDDRLRTARELAREIRGGHPLRSSLLLLTIILLIVTAAVWAANTELESVTRGDGRVVPSAETQLIQPSEPGVVSKIDVTEGQVVEPGAPLVTLDDTQIEGELGQAQRRVQALSIRIARLKAEIADTEFVPDPVLAAAAPDLAAAEQDLFKARLASTADELTVLKRQATQRSQEISEAQTRVETAGRTLGLVREEIALIRPLVEENVEPRTSLISLLGREAEAVGRKAEAAATLARARSAKLEVEDKITALRSKVRTRALEDFAKAQGDLAEVQSLLPGLKMRLSRSTLTAPVRGIVNRVLVSTVGSLARAGETIVEIVPVEDELRIEAYLDPADVAFVHPGQDVRVSITAYDPSRYGTIPARILRIGADAVTRPDRDQKAFVVEVKTLGVLTDADGAPVEILPGMLARVDILSGRKTVLDYVTAPIVRVKERALRDG